MMTHHVNEHDSTCVNMRTGDAQVDPVDAGDAGHQLHTPAWRQAATVRPGMCREWRLENAQMKKTLGEREK